jgi:putative transferase (TIGR04331 family)
MNRYLITTADKQTWVKDRPVLFLGDWCKCFSSQDQWSKLDYETVPYHWDDRELLLRDFFYLQDLYERLLKSLANSLNNCHGVERTVRYWRILVGPWLNAFIHVIFDRWQMITKARREYSLNGSTILKIDSDTMIPLGIRDFETLFTTDFWNHWVYGEIIKSQGIPSTLVDVSNVSVKEFHTAYLTHIVGRTGSDKTSFRGLADKYGYSEVPKASLHSKGKIKKILGFVLGNFSEILGKNKKYFFYGSYLGRRQWWLELALGQLPSFWSPYNNFEKTNINKTRREKLVLELNAESSFENFLLTLVPKQLPILYLEAYSSLVQKTKTVRWPKSPKLILTASSYLSDDFFKIWTAEKIENKSRLIIWQHGGYHGTRPSLTTHEHEKAIADNFFSWGWKDPNFSKAKALPAGKLLNAAANIKADSKGGLLLIQASHARYSSIIEGHPMASQCGSYFDEQMRFVENLTPSIRKKLLIRTFFIDFGWGQAKRWQEKFPGISFDKKNQSLTRSVSQNRLIVSTYNATCFMETLAANVPTVMYWNVKLYWEIHELAQPYFDRLHKVGIFHKTPESAAVHIELIWNDVEAWWKQEETQRAREDFCKQFCLTSPNWLMQWKKAVQNS